MRCAWLSSLDRKSVWVDFVENDAGLDDSTYVAGLPSAVAEQEVGVTF